MWQTEASYVRIMYTPRKRKLKKLYLNHVQQCAPEHCYQLSLVSYRCERLPGYKYPFKDYTSYLSGTVMESEFLEAVNDRDSRHDEFMCRLIESSISK